MRALVLALFLLFAAAPAPAADLVLKNKANGAELRLLDAPCSHGETLAVLKEEWRPKFKNAKILNAKGFIEFYGCWIKDDESVIVILQDGAAMEFQAAAFSDPSI